MAYSIIDHASAGDTGSGSATTSAINTTGATFIEVFIGLSDFNFGATLTDSKSNSWTLVNSFTDGNNSGYRYICINPTVGSGHTFTGSPAVFGSETVIGVVALSGNDASPTDQYNFNTSSNPTDIQPGSITPSQNNEFISTYLLAFSSAGTVTIDSGFTIVEALAFGASNFGLYIGSLIQTSASAVNPDWQWQNSISATADIGSYKAAAVASTTVSRLTTLGVS